MKKIKLLVEEENVDVFLKFVKTLDYVKVLHGENLGVKSEPKHPEDHIKEPLKKFLNKI
jgi:hypothetical protein